MSYGATAVVERSLSLVGVTLALGSRLILEEVWSGKL